MYFDNLAIEEKLQAIGNVSNLLIKSRFKHYSGSNRFGDGYVNLSFSTQCSNYLKQLYNDYIKTEKDGKIKKEKAEELEERLSNFFHSYCIKKLQNSLDMIESDNTLKRYLKENKMISVVIVDDDMDKMMLWINAIRIPKKTLSNIENILTDSVVKEKAEESLQNNNSLPEFITQSSIFLNEDSWLQIYKENLEDVKIDLSKFALGKGYGIYIQHYGATDPLLGGIEGPYWYDDKNVFIGVLNYFNKSEELKLIWLDKLMSEGNKVDNIINNVDNVDDISLADVYEYLFKVDKLTIYIAESDIIKDIVIEDKCLIGITDKNYLDNILSKNQDSDDYFYTPTIVKKNK